jgi:hypothetical protein
MRQRIRGTILLVAGIAILASAMLHGVVNVPHLNEDLLELGVRRTLIGTVALVLYFSVVAMFAFATLVLSNAVGSLRGNQQQQAPLWIVAATYVLFGAAGFLLVSRSPHMLGYTFMGLLVAAGAAISSTRAGKDMRGAA